MSRRTKSPIHMCVDRRLPSDRTARAEAAAIADRPDNVRVVPVPGALPGRARMAMVTRLLWRPGTHLDVAFLDGEPSVKERVETVAHKWEDHTNVKFVFDGAPAAMIRISFEQEGSWSYIGQDAKHIDANEPTMNFGWLTADTDEAEYSRVVLHEFGHALGCVHEHQSPSVTIPWDVDAVYAYYALQGWSHEETDQNVLIPYSPAGMQFSRFDPESIMLYPVDERLTIGNFSVGWNTALSELDESFIRAEYPDKEQPIVPIEVGGPAVQGEIAEPGEVDWYTFAADGGRRFVLETLGATDTVMSLHGPGSQATVVAADDDSGGGLNARIERDLEPGTYYVQVRHYGKTGVGAYQLCVTAS